MVPWCTVSANSSNLVLPSSSLSFVFYVCLKKCQKALNYSFMSIIASYVVNALILWKLLSKRFIWNTRYLGNLMISCFTFALDSLWHLSHLYRMSSWTSCRCSLMHLLRLYLCCNDRVMNAFTVSDKCLHFSKMTVVCCKPLNSSSIIETYYLKYSEHISKSGLIVSAAPLNLAVFGVSSSWSYSKI